MSDPVQTLWDKQQEGSIHRREVHRSMEPSMGKPDLLPMIHRSRKKAVWLKPSLGTFLAAAVSAFYLR